jgi:formate dehydrogenase major subunit
VKAIELDETGRIKPVFATGEELVMDADTVVVAIGQKPSPPPLGLDLIIDPWTLTTNLPGVYAGGDLVTGPTMAVQAMAAGKKAARYIHRHLNGKLEIAELARRQPEKLSKEEYRKRLAPQKRYQIPEEAAESRIKDFREVEQTYSRTDAQAEARRCVSRRICSEYKELE